MTEDVFFIKFKGKTADEAFASAVNHYKRGIGVGYTVTIANKKNFVMLGKASYQGEAVEKAKELLKDTRINSVDKPAGVLHLTDTDYYFFFGWAISKRY